MYSVINEIKKCDTLVIYEDNLLTPTSYHEINELDWDWMKKYVGYHNVDWQVNNKLRIKILQDYGNDFNDGDISLNLITHGIGYNNHSIAEKDRKLYLIFPNKPAFKEMIMIYIGDGSFDLTKINDKRPFQINTFLRNGFVEFEVNIKYRVNCKSFEEKIICANKMFSEKHIFDPKKLDRTLSNVNEYFKLDKDYDISEIYNVSHDFQDLNYITEFKLIEAGFSYNADNRTFFKGDLKIVRNGSNFHVNGEWCLTMTELLTEVTNK